MNKQTLFAVFWVGVLLGAFLLFALYSPSGVLGGGDEKIVPNMSTSTVVSVTSASTTLLTANSLRNGVIFSMPRNSTSAVWLACSYDRGAVVGEGIQLSASTTAIFEQKAPRVLSCPWSGISDNATVPLGVSEY